RKSVDEAGNVTDYGDLTPEQYDAFLAQEEILLSITVNGYGKRTNAFEYRVTNRGGSGIINIETSDRNGDVIATFPIAEDEQIMLVTNGGKLIRTPVTDIRIAGRNTQGVTLFKTADGEEVVSVTTLAEGKDGENGNGEEAEEGSVETSSSDAPVTEVPPDEPAGDDEH
ncbi:MAG: DNA gyrase subunit A, partial [Alphaproteobacteria bacterium]